MLHEQGKNAGYALLLSLSIIELIATGVICVVLCYVCYHTCSRFLTIWKTSAGITFPVERVSDRELSHPMHTALYRW